MAKRKERVLKTKFKSNPANERAGIDASKIGYSSAAQRTATKEEINTFQKTGRSTAQQERLRATKRADPSSKGDVQRAVDARNAERGFPSGDVPLRAPAINNAPPEIQPGQEGFIGPMQQQQDFNTLQELSPETTGDGENFFDRLGQTLRTGEISQDPGFNRELTAESAAQIGVTGLGIGAAAVGLSSILASIGTSTTLSTLGDATAGKAVRKTATKVATNTVTAAKTTSFLSKLYKGAGLAVGMGSFAFAIVGTYPFSGFIKEESLQQLGLTSSRAIEEGNYEAAERALQQEMDILNPGVWDQVLAVIPSANILNQVKKFLKAAALDVEVKAKKIERLRAGELNPEEQGFADRAAAQAERDERFNVNQPRGPPSVAELRKETGWIINAGYCNIIKLRPNGHNIGVVYV